MYTRENDVQRAILTFRDGKINRALVTFISSYFSQYFVPGSCTFFWLILFVLLFRSADILSTFFNTFLYIMDSASTNSPDCLLSMSGGHLQYVLDENGLEYTPDGKFIRWSASNKKHPRNWHMSRKIYDSSLIIFLDFFTLDPTAYSIPSLLR